MSLLVLLGTTLNNVPLPFRPWQYNVLEGMGSPTPFPPRDLPNKGGFRDLPNKGGFRDLPNKGGFRDLPKKGG
jgi:hypothetical protein